MNSSAKRLDLLATLFAGASLLFPPAAAIGMHWFGPWPILVALLVCLLARVVIPSAAPVPTEIIASLLIVATAVVMTSLYDAELAARLYPVFMNASMLMAFAATLWKPPSMIERFARIAEPDLDERGVAYTRIVTWVWIAFFIANGSAALWTALHGSWLIWGLYNGGISYVLAGLLFAGEFCIRQIVRAKDRPS